jgi:dTDP-4-amino-4,6-dideoxygalactose transaminase
MTNETIRFFDLGPQTRAIKAEVLAAFEDVMERTAFSGGPAVEDFEEGFARFSGVSHAIGVGNGTDAVWAALLAAGVKAGDEVITVPNTFIATAEAISFCGATPVFVDIEMDSYNRDPEQLRGAISPRTRAIVPVHLFGQMADMGPIREIAEESGVPIVEDASQAHGATYQGHPAGSMGTAGCFSFYPAKNLGAWGEAGAVVTPDADVAAWIRSFRNHGQAEKNEHGIIGWNARMDGFQGAVLSVKLRHIEAWTASRRRHAAHYDRRLAGIPGLVAPLEVPGRRHVYHLYVVRTPDRDGVRSELARRGIETGMHYPRPIHLQDAYASLGYGPGSFPKAETLAREGVSLPMYPELRPEEIDRVADALEEIFQGVAGRS